MEKNNKSNDLNTSTMFSSKFYYWILLKFGSDSSITTRCFEEIFDTFVNLDIEIQQNPDNETYQLLFKSTCDIFFVYCNVKNFFCPLHLDKISQCKNNDILSIVFEHYLPLLFGIEVTQILLPLPSTEEFYIQYTSNSNTKRKGPKQELEDWFANLQIIYFKVYYGSINTTEEFKQYLFTFCDTKLPQSKFVQNQKNKTNKKK
ncbi:36517_t:CDS:1, partial [Gigaspora margarita]